MSSNSKVINWMRNIALIVAIIIAAYATQTAVNASGDAKKAKHEAVVVTYELKVAEYNRAVKDQKRAIGTCTSSTDLRNLWDDINTIVVGAFDPTDPALGAFSARIKAYTGTNPNCANVPPVPVKPVRPKELSDD